MKWILHLALKPYNAKVAFVVIWHLQNQSACQQTWIAICISGSQCKELLLRDLVDFALLQKCGVEFLGCVIEGSEPCIALCGYFFGCRTCSVLGQMYKWNHICGSTYKYHALLSVPVKNSIDLHLCYFFFSPIGSQLRTIVTLSVTNAVGNDREIRCSRGLINLSHLIALIQ